MEVIQNNKDNTSNKNNTVYLDISKNLCFLEKTLGNSIGLNIGKFKIGNKSIDTSLLPESLSSYDIGIVYLESISDKQIIRDYVIEPLEKEIPNFKNEAYDMLTIIQQTYLISVSTKREYLMDNIVNELLLGNTILFLEDCKNALVVQSRKLEKRAIEKPSNETTIHASLESFTENTETNVSMIIKRLPIPNLQFENFTIGNISCTNVKLIWINNIANPNILTEIRDRLNKINIDSVNGIGTIAEFLQDKPLSIFPTYKQTERPDVVTKSLSDGNYALLCDNSPFALIIPINFWDFFKTMDDYSQLTFSSSLLRIIRFIAFLMSIIISPLYLAFVTYNHTIVPASLALNISSSRQGVPFPSIFELIVMTIIIDIIREAGVRMPGAVGYFIGTLGAVIIGQAAVAAGYVSVSVIIVVALSALSSFAISSTLLINTSRLMNYFLILLSGIFGIFGFLNGLFIFILMMVTLESFGVPYLYPIIPLEFEGWKDILIRTPIKTLKSRLKLIAPKNRKRINNNK